MSELPAGLTEALDGADDSVCAGLVAALSRDWRSEPGGARVQPGEDLAAAIASAGEAATVVLEPGEHVLSETIELPARLTLLGAGAGQSRIRISAPEVGLRVPNSADLTARGLGFEREGSASSTLLEAAPEGAPLQVDLPCPFCAATDSSRSRAGRSCSWATAWGWPVRTPT